MKKWTVVNLIRCVNDAYQVSCLIKMLDDLYRFEVPEDISFVLCINITRKDIPLIDKDYVPKPGANPCRMTTMFYSLEKPAGRGSRRKSGLVRIADEQPDFDPLTQQDVQWYFSQIVLKSYRASQYMLFTWGHGAAYGLYFDSNPPNPGEKFEMLSMDDLAAAIKGAFGGGDQKVNVVVMMDCFMQFFDTGYTLSLAGVDYLAASVFGADFMGYNYRKLFGDLFSNSGIAPVELAKLAVTSISSNSLSNVALKRELRDAIFYTVDLSKYGDLAKNMSELAGKLLARLPGDIEKIRKARNDCQILHSFYDLIDFFRFVRALRKEFGEAWEKPLVDRILNSTSDFILAQFLGKGVVRSGPMESYPLGYSFCIPLEGTTDFTFYRTYFDPASTFASPFTKDPNFKWSGFVKTFVEQCPHGIRTGGNDPC